VLWKRFPEAQGAKERNKTDESLPMCADRQAHLRVLPAAYLQGSLEINYFKIWETIDAGNPENRRG
jgi:hypothetical protein